CTARPNGRSGTAAPREIVGYPRKGGQVSLSGVGLPPLAMRQIGEEDLARAATLLVKTGLRVTAGERFVAVGDLESQPMLAALETAAREQGADAAGLRIDLLRSYSTNHSGERPHKVLPDAVRRAMLSAQASAFVASAP